MVDASYFYSLIILGIVPGSISTPGVFSIRGSVTHMREIASGSTPGQRRYCSPGCQFASSPSFPLPVLVHNSAARNTSSMVLQIYNFMERTVCSISQSGNTGFFGEYRVAL